MIPNISSKYQLLSSALLFPKQLLFKKISHLLRQSPVLLIHVILAKIY